MPVLAAIDQGTTGSTALILAGDGNVLGRGYQTHRQFYPSPGWVEHDPLEILQTVDQAVDQALSDARERHGLAAADIAAVGLANQRETVVLWDRATGSPVGPAIVWQCRRTASTCERLRSDGVAPEVLRRTGLVLDPYFSATKIAWALDRDPQLRSKAERGTVLAGTVDSWLVWNWTEGTVHGTDATNASRTSLFSLSAREWDPVLLDLFRVPAGCLPAVAPSAGIFGTIGRGPLFGKPLAGIAGDQQAALFGHRVASAGGAKNTYGTGCFLLEHTGTGLEIRDDGILSTIACGPRGEPQYAREGSIFIAGAAIQWLRDELGILTTAAESEALARRVDSASGVVLVPAFTGLGAPYWDAGVRGALFGLTRGTNRSHLARAALEAIAFQTVDLCEAMGIPGKSRNQPLNVDGGATSNDLLMQIQADLLGIPVSRAAQQETTALGAAYLAGIGAGIWSDVKQLPAGSPPEVFEPAISAAERDHRLARWRSAVQASRAFQG